MPVKPIPEGHHTVTPYLVLEGAAKFLDFVKRAFDAKEDVCCLTPDGKVMHAEFKIGDSYIMVGEAGPEWKAMPASIHLYVPDADAVYRRALKAGAKSVRAPADQFYGDRSGGVQDSFGNYWWMSTHVEDVSKEEIDRRTAEFLKQKGGG